MGTESTPHVLARHISDTVRQVLYRLPAAERVHAANHILESVSTLNGAREWVDLVADGPRQLLAVAEPEAPGVYAIRPATPLSDTALITNAPDDPNLGFELRRYKNTDIGGAQPWMLLGPVQYVKHEGSKPMAITWELMHELPADVLTYAAIAAG